MLAEYDFEVKYITSRSNLANSPFRRPDLRLDTLSTFKEETLPSLQAKLAVAKRSVVSVMTLFKRMRAKQEN